MKRLAPKPIVDLLMPFGAVLLLCACPAAEPTYTDLNDDNNCVEIEVRPGDEGDAATVDITDRGGDRVLGTFTVTPTAGPVNTVHQFRVDLTEAGFIAEVDRALLVFDNNFEDRTDGGIGPTEFIMDPVAGLDGAFDAEIGTGGEADESRTDMVCVFAQQLVEE